MDYEKEYKSLVAKVKKAHQFAQTDSTKSVLEDILPQLRESEDERVIRTLYYLVRDHDWVNGATKGEALTWLEKQKENPKNADSIPADCVSNAKCEDRWHKVGDSLPDNGRLVLANDCLGNILLARYDGEGNWEVSVYDNDDYYCRNTITKWCDIPSVKQKEQKPAEWSEVELEFRGEKVTVKRPFYRDDKGRGYSTVELDEGVAWNALRAWCEKKGISLYDLYPKSEWSEEDEDMLNCCISSIEEAKENRYAYKETDGDTSYDREIAFLKSLRPSWKPSEEQLDALKELIDDANRAGWVTPGATELYEQLKKL